MMSVREKMAHVRPLLGLSSEERRNFLNSFDTVITDCDGVLWSLYDLIPGTGEALNDLEASGKKVIYVSNNSIRSEKAYEAKMTKIGFKFKPENLVHPIATTIRYLKKINYQGPTYVIGTTYTKNLIREAGFKVLEGPNGEVEEDFLKIVTLAKDNEPVKFVIMDVDHNFSYMKYLRAELYLRDPECQLILGATDHRLLIPPTFNIPGPGFFTDALTAALPPGKKPILLGKPGVELGKMLKEHYEIKDPEKVLFIGDSLSSDIKLARDAGFQSLLVLSGGITREQMLVNDDDGGIPDFYAESLRDLSALIHSVPPQSAL